MMYHLSERLSLYYFHHDCKSENKSGIQKAARRHEIKPSMLCMHAMQRPIADKRKNIFIKKQTADNKQGSGRLHLV